MLTLIKAIEKVINSTQINNRTHLEYLLRDALWYLRKIEEEKRN